VGVSVGVAPIEGEAVGQGTLPACNDSGEGSQESAEEVDLARISGVSPEVALAWAGHPQEVLVREGLDEKDQPEELARLFHAPTCESADEPIMLQGPWLGILGANGHTELDLLPPYDVHLYVVHASVPRYERAYLTVRVPENLGQPITHMDVESSLWRGGSISLTAKCGDHRYLATEVAAQPG
jgi:hypothetical protein